MTARAAPAEPTHGAHTLGVVPAARERSDPTWVTLGSGARSGDDEPPPLRAWRVFGQLVVATVVVLVVVAFLGLAASKRIAEQESVNDAARQTDLVADAVVQPALVDGVVTSDDDAVAALDAAVRGSVLGEEIVRVKLWDADGQIVYSDDERLIGQTFPLGEDETDALENPTTQAEVSDLDEPENVYERGQGKLLEVYRPVWTPDGTPLLFETYSRYDVVTERSGSLWSGFAGITLTSLLLLVVLMLPVLWTLVDRLGRSQRQREVLLQRAVEASDEERRRIAATLHDGVVQELAASSFALAGAAEQAERSQAPELAEPLRAAASTVRASIKGLRTLLVDIYPASLQTAGLGAALTDLVGGLAGRGANIRLELPASGGIELSDEDERVVYRVAQETLRNAVAHAAASRIVVRLTPGDEEVVLEVEDDGVGFDAREALAVPAGGHFGLRLLTDLASSSGARLEVRTAPGTGCLWRLTVHDNEGSHG
jgi:two-component system, NarL family, sensor kinase